MLTALLLTLMTGFIVSFLGAIPVAGPISAMVLRRALTGAPSKARAIGLGAAVAEAIYAGLAFYGVEIAFATWPGLQAFSHWLTLGILFGLAIYFIRFKSPNPELAPAADANQTSPRSSGFFIGLTVAGMNLTLLATWGAVWTFLRTKTFFESNALTPFAFSLGVFFGISTWFVLAVWGISRAGAGLQPKTIQRLVRGMGYALLIAGLRWVWIIR
jgi:threonine/homoserine/homoserine lactone efflux protein